MPGSRRPRPLGHAAAASAVGFATLAAVFGAAGVWAGTASLSGAVLAPGRVAILAQRQVLQHPHGGVVREIHVRPGQRVEEGDLLIRLDTAAIGAEIAVHVRRRADLMLQETRLAADRDGRSAFATPADADLAVEGAAALRADQQAIFEARRNAYRGEASALQQTIAQSEARIEGLTTRRASIERQKVLILDELAGLRGLYEKGYVTKPRVLALERSADDLSGQSGDLAAQIAQARERIAEARIRIEQLDRDRVEKAAAELQAVRAERGKVEPQLAEARERLARTALRAPRSGEVVDLTAHTLGGVLKPGEQVLAIIPSDSPLVVEADVLPADIENVAAGMGASVRLTGLRLPDIPVVAGSVARVSADRAQVDRPQAARTYPITVQLDRPEAEIARALRVGMPAEVVVPTRRRTVLEYLLAPLSNGFARVFRED